MPNLSLLQEEGFAGLPVVEIQFKGLGTLGDLILSFLKICMFAPLLDHISLAQHNLPLENRA